MVLLGHTKLGHPYTTPAISDIDQIKAIDIALIKRFAVAQKAREKAYYYLLLMRAMVTNAFKKTGSVN